MSEKMGVQDLIELLDFLIALGHAVDRSLADGKMSAEDMLHLIPVMTSAGPALGGLMNVPKEIADMSAEESEMVYKHIEQKFDIANDKVEEIVETSLAVAVSIYGLVKKIMDLNKVEADVE